VDLEIRIAPRPAFGARRARVNHSPRLGWRYCWSDEILSVRTEMPLQQVGDDLHALYPIREGERVCVSFSYARADLGVLSPLGAEADQRLARTLDWWRRWADQCTYDGPYRDAVLRSAITLKLMTFVVSGAIIAAPTTSLPETIGGARNWDYRFCWLRDAGLTMRALVGLGFHQEARAFLSWLLHATRLTWPRLQVVYDVYGRAHLSESELTHFRGYRGSSPVRVGNGAWSQVQLDVYGEVVLAAHAYVSGGGALDAAEARMLKGFGQIACRSWREPDHGIWEVRGARRQYTFSKVMCWLALDRLIDLHEKGALSLGASLARFEAQRAEIHAVIDKQGFNTRIGSYTSELDGDSVDASLLLMACLGYRSADDARLRSSYQVIRERLERNGLIHRYERGYDDLSGDEGAFGICSFWAVDYLACRGDLEEAVELFERLLAYASDLGLYAEQIDPNTGAALGNYPQAFTHIGLINAALAIERARGASSSAAGKKVEERPVPSPAVRGRVGEGAAEILPPPSRAVPPSTGQPLAPSPALRGRVGEGAAGTLHPRSPPPCPSPASRGRGRIDQRSRAER
jgi:GH15 family glucan-1,4-alpha-glucosidase